ncbi:MAG: hypothetical protein DIKNOCCD_01586 [bacterium]|nr:hypothetical protein [bacterium]MBV6481857.1 hypothetical protein [bacterium]MCE7909165.1 hypothetical protein [Candidatus Omnitrophica bacterium COP1]
MEDPKLDADIEQVKELISIWQTYYRLLLAAFDREKKLPPNADDEFQKIKTIVAQRHDHFSSVIIKDHYVAQNILQMVKRTISIFDFEKSSSVAVDKTLIEWHEANILLYETLGALEYKRHKISKVSEAEHRAEERKRARQEKIEKIRGNPQLYMAIKFAITVSAIAIFWFSPISTWVGSIPFVKARIEDFQEVFGMKKPEETPQKPGEKPAAGDAHGG